MREGTERENVTGGKASRLDGQRVCYDRGNVGLHLQAFDSPLGPLLELLFDSNLLIVYANGLTELSQQEDRTEPVYIVHTVQSQLEIRQTVLKQSNLGHVSQMQKIITN